MENDPSEPLEKLPYEPEDFGLDVNIREDLDIYTQSSGDMLLAAHLIAKRTIQQRHNAGVLDDETYSYRLNELDDKIVRRRDALGLNT